MDRELDKLIEMLSIVDEEKLDCDLAQRMMEKLNWSLMPEIGDVFGNLYHYWHDEDIRDKDEEYAEMQNGELVKLIGHLKLRNFDLANKISFLCKTENS